MYQACAAQAGRFFLGRGRLFHDLSAYPQTDYLYMVPLACILSVDALGLVQKAGGDETSVARMGLYGSDQATGLPTNLIAEVELTGMSDNGHKIGVLEDPVQLYGGEWLAAVFGGASVTIAASNISFSEPESQYAFGHHQISGTPGSANALSIAHTYGALPDPFPTSGFGLVYNNFALAVRAG